MAKQHKINAWVIGLRKTYKWMYIYIGEYIHICQTAAFNKKNVCYYMNKCNLHLQHHSSIQTLLQHYIIHHTLLICVFILLIIMLSNEWLISSGAFVQMENILRISYHILFHNWKTNFLLLRKSCVFLIKFLYLYLKSFPINN